MKNIVEIPKVSLSSLQGNILLEHLKKRGGITLFVGSAISQWYPTCISPGENVTKNIAQLLVDQFELKHQKIKIFEQITRMPFEYLWEQCPVSPGVENILAKEYYPKLPNPVHEAIGRSLNARRVLSKVQQSTVLWGDLVHIFSGLGQECTVQSFKSPQYSTLDLERLLGKTNLKLWACSVLTPPGYAKQAEELTLKMLAEMDKTKKEHLFVLKTLASAEFSRGKYIKSAIHADQSAREFKKKAEWKWYVKSRSQQIDALRCAGMFLAAKLILEITLKEIKTESPEPDHIDRIMSQLDLKKVLILRPFYQLINWLGLYKQAAKVKHDARSLLIRICNNAAEHGEWHDLQQARMWAGRFGIDFSEIYTGSLQPLEDWEGFHHLGFIVPEMMAARDSLWRNAGTLVKADDLKRHIDTAKEIGCEPEEWKLILALITNFGQSKNYHWWDWIKPFLNCEYTPWMRVFLLSNPEHR